MEAGFAGEYLLEAKGRFPYVLQVVPIFEQIFIVHSEQHCDKSKQFVLA